MLFNGCGGKEKEPLNRRFALVISMHISQLHHYSFVPRLSANDVNYVGW